MKEHLSTAFTRAHHVSKEVRVRTIGYIVAAFGLVAGLAWNAAITGVIEYIYPAKENSLFAKFIYALLLTALLVAVSTWLVRWADKGNEEKK